MIAVEHIPPEAEIFAGLNNIIARSTSPKVKTIDLNSYESLKSQDDSAPKVQPSLAKPKYQLWPNLKRNVSSPGSSTTDSKTMRNPFKDSGLNRSHKISVPDLGKLATIQEKSQDSRSSAFRPPVLGPAVDFCSFTAEQSGGRSSPSPNIDNNKGRTYAHRAESDGHLPVNSSPKIVTSDQPPEVPPKSPRLGHRTPNIPTLSSTGDISSASTSGTPGGSQGSRSLENSPCRNSPRQLSQTPCSGSFVTPTTSGGTIMPSSSLLSMTESISHRRCRKELGQPFPFNFRSEKASMNINNHRRGISHDSVLKWGNHPLSKHMGFEVRIDDREMTKQLPGIPDVPQGIPVDKAFMVLPRTEIETLQRQAHSQAQKFEVLNRCDVKSLSRELRALQKRCDYLKETYNSLRAGRNSLHQRMISYLKSPRVAKFSREGILKQEEALFELDKSIDEWYSKLENAEQRRALVRQKLLEHLAAILVLRESQPDPPSLEKRAQVDNLHEGHNHCRPSRKVVESIKIYADAEIQALFANIEKDMERMANSGSPPPTLPAVAFSPELDKKEST
ncbi:hypothetical protein PRK78_002681 [Emydomyces testavorans]|uniref:Up-regulated during septation protein 1 domain-containing protein n=1 Tax=Emydomyces testavorans TaxID=2070801 RepID=A0AAF0DES5_9EURO|nr:hypothetical protein PRK78_002681 [Emydomyces testavorans]